MHASGWAATAHKLLFCFISDSHHMIDIDRSGRPGRKGRIAMNAQFRNKISRLFDKPLTSSLTALAVIALSIIVSISLS